MPHKNDELFFATDDLRGHLAKRQHDALAEVDQYQPNQLLNANLEDLVGYFVAKYRVNSPSIVDGGVSVDQSEAKIDVSGRFDYGGWDGERVVVPGTEVTLHIQFEGEIALIRLRGSTFSMNPPRGRIAGSEVIITFRAPTAEAPQAKGYFDDQLRKLREALDWMSGDVSAFNSALATVVRQAIEQRRQRLLANQNTLSTLGFPLRARPDAPKTYAIPDVRRNAVPVRPVASSAPFVPEPALDNQTYEQILSVLGNMVRVMEQSPEAFSTMGEQDLRTHFLVQLNGQFEGRASGETFHGSGKTDILLIENDRSVFIGECKFWEGPASLTDAIDQLLDYATWRDAKAAILVFSRNVDFSAVVAQVPDVIKAHPQTSGDVATVSETVFRSRLRQRGDSARELVLTTLVYNIPTTRTTSTRLQPRPGRGMP